jgi:hypothetical protein
MEFKQHPIEAFRANALHRGDHDRPIAVTMSKEFSAG